MLRAAVLGSPIAHSLSPALHRAGYAALGLGDWEYTARQVEVDQLPEVVAALDEEWRGLSLTMPLKEAALSVATTVDEAATRCGAANTLVRRADGGWDATNTDIAGIVAALRPSLRGPARRAVVIGSGATARSALLALPELGVRSVRVLARDVTRAQALREWARARGLELEPAALSEGVGDGSEVIVSTVPPQAAGSVVAALPGRSRAVLLDVVYAGWPTPVARAARDAGMRVVSGLDMLVGQAAEQFRLFTGHRAPVAVMLAAGRAALGD